MNLLSSVEQAVSTRTKMYSSQTLLLGVPTVLPQPEHEYRIHDAHFFVYKVKDSRQNFFPDTNLQTIVKESRKSYLRYGDIPLLDQYDLKSSLYLTRVVYPQNIEGISVLVEEWVSVRFVPTSGTPNSTEDLDACIYRGKPLSTTVTELSTSISISRICRVPPKVAPGQDHFSGIFLPHKNKYTSLAFVFMNHQFLQEKKDQDTYQLWFTALAKPELFSNVLSLADEQKSFHFPFTPVLQKLISSHLNQFRIQRTVLSYRHPGYFLDLYTLLRLFRKLIDFGRLSEKTWQKYFHTSLGIAEFQENFDHYSYQDMLPHFLGLAELLLSPGWIENSRMHGTELRSLVDICVPDAVELSVCPYDKWKDHIQNIVNYYTE